MSRRQIIIIVSKYYKMSIGVYFFFLILIRSKIIVLQPQLAHYSSDIVHHFSILETLTPSL